MTFSQYHDNSSPLFKRLNILNFHDLVNSYIAVSIYKFYNKLLPSVFDALFTWINHMHNYNTRLSTKLSYSLPKIRTNYRVYNIRLKAQRFRILLMKALSFLNLIKTLYLTYY